MPFTHGCLDVLSELVTVLNEISVRVLFYANPVNVGLGGRIHGESFLEMLRAKVATTRAATSWGGR